MKALISCDDFNDKIPTTLDPCDDLVAADTFDESVVEENTPTILDPCPECGRQLTRLVDWMPPPTPEAAWYGWVDSCVATESSIWLWCPSTGWLTARLRVRCLRLPAPAGRTLNQHPSS